jgi:hypothetical protein
MPLGKMGSLAVAKILPSRRRLIRPAKEGELRPPGDQNNLKSQRTTKALIFRDTIIMSAKAIRELAER